MLFNPGDGTGIVDEINDICSSTDTSFTLKSKARRVNAALDRFFFLAQTASRAGMVDDMNNTTAPIESINLVSGTQSYAIDDFASEVQDYIRWEVLDADGNKILLDRLNREKVGGALTAYKTGGGTPKEYDIVGKFIYLYPAPNYSVSNGLTLYFDRNKSAVTASDTTKVIGIPSRFHPYICRFASLQYVIDHQHPNKNDLAALIVKDEDDITTFYATRERGVSKGVRPLIENCK